MRSSTDPASCHRTNTCHLHEDFIRHTPTWLSNRIPFSTARWILAFHQEFKLVLVAFQMHQGHLGIQCRH